MKTTTRVEACEARIKELKEGAVHIEAARNTAFDLAEAFASDNDTIGNREARTIEKELKGLRTRMEKLLQNERALHTHLKNFEAAPCSHEWKNDADAKRERGEEPGSMDWIYDTCTKCGEGRA